MYLVLNYKSYEQVIGEEAAKATEEALKVCKEKGVTLYVAPNLVDTSYLASKFPGVVLLQHADPISYGRGTGKIPVAAAKKVGCVGVLINHSEDKRTLAEIRTLIEMCDDLGLISLVCCETVDEVEALCQLSPSMIAIEPPELIGTGKSVSKHKPDVVKEAATVCKEYGIPLLCGAGVSTGEDVKAALELGAEGVLLASAFAKSADKRKFVEELLKYL